MQGYNVKNSIKISIYNYILRNKNKKIYISICCHIIFKNVGLFAASIISFACQGIRPYGKNVRGPSHCLAPLDRLVERSIKWKHYWLHHWHCTNTGTELPSQITSLHSLYSLYKQSLQLEILELFLPSEIFVQ